MACYSHEAPAIGKLTVMSLTLAGLAIIHFIDYYLINDGHLATIQFIRLSSLITVFGSVSLVVLINDWTKTFAAKTGKSRLGEISIAALILIATMWGVRQARKPDAIIHFGVVRYAEQQSNWINICRWIRSNGRRDAVYLTPPGANGFTSWRRDPTSPILKTIPTADFTCPNGSIDCAIWLEDLCPMDADTKTGNRSTELMER